MLGLVKGFIYGDNPHVQQTQSQIASGELQGDAGGRGELRCIGGETDTSCSSVRLLTVPPIALGAWSMALVLWQPPMYYYSYDFDVGY